MLRSNFLCYSIRFIWFNMVTWYPLTNSLKQSLSLVVPFGMRTSSDFALVMFKSEPLLPLTLVATSSSIAPLSCGTWSPVSSSVIGRTWYTGIQNIISCDYHMTGCCLIHNTFFRFFFLTTTMMMIIRHTTSTARRTATTPPTTAHQIWKVVGSGGTVTVNSKNVVLMYTYQKKGWFTASSTYNPNYAACYCKSIMMFCKQF